MAYQMLWVHERCTYKIAYDIWKRQWRRYSKAATEKSRSSLSLYEPITFMIFILPAGKRSDKGGVENAGKEAVRRFFVPYPRLIHWGVEWISAQRMHKAFGKQSEMGSGKGSFEAITGGRFDGARYKEAKVNRYSMVQFELTDTLFHDICGRESHC